MMSRAEAHPMHNPLVHRLESFGFPTALALATWLSNMPTLQIFGLVISVGWLVLGVVKEVRQWKDRGGRAVSASARK